MASEFELMIEGLRSRGNKVKILITMNRVEMKDMISVGVDDKYFKSFNPNFADAVREVRAKIESGKAD